MESQYLLSQQLLLAQAVANLQYLAENAPLLPEIHALNLIASKRQLYGPELTSEHLIPSIKLYNHENISLKLPQLQQPSFSFGTSLPKSTYYSSTKANSASITSENCDLYSNKPKMKEQESTKTEEKLSTKNTPIKGLLSGSKKIQKVKAEDSPLEAIKTEKSSPEEKGSVQKRKNRRNRRPADQIERMFECPLKYCKKSYGSETSLRAHINNKHTHAINPERICQIEVMLDKLAKKDDLIL